MKKLFIAALLVAGVGLSAFAFDGSKVNYKVKSSFEKEFFAAKNVSWTVGADFTKASFFIEDEKIEAFYSFAGVGLIFQQANFLNHLFFSIHFPRLFISNQQAQVLFWPY